MEKSFRELAGGEPSTALSAVPHGTDGLLEYAPTWRLTVDKESSGLEEIISR